MALVQALPGGQQGAGAVGVDGAAFQREVDSRRDAASPKQPSHAGADQLVVVAGLELAAPAGEAEIEQAERIGSRR
jgi:hypothetical protein